MYLNNRMTLVLVLSSISIATGSIAIQCIRKNEKEKNNKPKLIFLGIVVGVSVLALAASIYKITQKNNVNNANKAVNVAANNAAKAVNAANNAAKAVNEATNNATKAVNEAAKAVNTAANSVK